jgi:hypothetical protein
MSRSSGATAIRCDQRQFSGRRGEPLDRRRGDRPGGRSAPGWPVEPGRSAPAHRHSDVGQRGGVHISIAHYELSLSIAQNDLSRVCQQGLSCVPLAFFGPTVSPFSHPPYARFTSPAYQTESRCVCVRAITSLPVLLWQALKRRTWMNTYSVPGPPWSPPDCVVLACDVCAWCGRAEQRPSGCPRGPLTRSRYSRAAERAPCASSKRCSRSVATATESARMVSPTPTAVLAEPPSRPGASRPGRPPHPKEHRYCRHRGKPWSGRGGDGRFPRRRVGGAFVSAGRSAVADGGYCYRSWGIRFLRKDIATISTRCCSASR